MPTGAPAISCSARCAARASVSSSSSRPKRAVSARPTAMASAALDERPLPTGTVESMRASNPRNAPYAARPFDMPLT